MNKTALITGASGGLGREFARIFAREGYDLLLVARSGDKLAALKGEIEAAYPVRAAVLAQDLAREEAAEAVFAAASGAEIAVLVNNAGFGDFGPFAACDWAKQHEMERLNMVVLTQLTRLFLPGMLARKEGKILNVASIAAFQAGPLMAVYYASKAFVLSFSEALAVECRSAGVTVTALCPGPTKTGFEKKADLAASGLFKNLRVGGAKEVAEYGYRALMRGHVVAVAGFFNKLIVCVAKFAPRALVRACVYRVQR